MGNVKFKCYERSAENGTAQVCFEISDTGIGMGEEFLKHIFEPFTQEEGGASIIDRRQQMLRRYPDFLPAVTLRF